MYYIKWHFWKVNYASRLICVATYQFNWQLEILKMSTFCKTIISRHCWRLLTLSDVWLSDVDDFVLKLILWTVEYQNSLVKKLYWVFPYEFSVINWCLTLNTFSDFRGLEICSNGAWQTLSVDFYSCSLGWNSRYFICFFGLCEVSC